MPILLAIGTSLLVILFSASLALIGKIATSQFNLAITVWVILGAIPAAQMGVWIAKKARVRCLRLLLLMLLAMILVKTIWSGFTPRVSKDPKLNINIVR